MCFELVKLMSLVTDASKSELSSIHIDFKTLEIQETDRDEIGSIFSYEKTWISELKYIN